MGHIISILSDGHKVVLLLLIFNYSTGDWTDPWLFFKTKRSSFDEWGFYRQNYVWEVDLKVLKKNRRIAMKKPN